MTIRIFLFLLGFGITVIGCVYIITYLNLLTIGYHFKDYMLFIVKRVECVMALIGIAFMWISMLWVPKKIGLSS